MTDIELQDELSRPCSSREIGLERKDLKQMDILVENFALALNSGRIGDVFAESKQQTVLVNGPSGVYRAVDRDGLRKTLYGLYEFHRRFPERRIDAAFQHYVDSFKVRDLETLQASLNLLSDICYCEHYGLQTFYTDFSVINMTMERFLRDHAEDLMDMETYEGSNCLLDILRDNKENFEYYGRYLFHCPGLSYMKETLRNYYFDCANIEKTARYYEKKLFMEREPMIGHDKNCIVLRFGYYRIFLRTGSQKTVRELSGCGHDAYFVTGGQKDLYERFRNAGADFYRPIHFTAFGGMEFVVRDPDGRDLVFGREMVPTSPLEWPHFPPKRQAVEKEMLTSEEKKNREQLFREREIENRKNLFAFGRYPQGADCAVDVWGCPAKSDEMQPIWWRVVAEEGGKRLLISERVLFSMPYDLPGESGSARYVLSWEQSALRRFLNEDFLEMAFSSDERERIVATRQEPVGRTKVDRNIVEDRVFVLSAREAQDVLPDEVDRMARETAFVQHQLDPVSSAEGEPGRWWLRTHSQGGRRVGTVSEDGVIELEFRASATNIGVRPAIWVWKKK